MSSWCRYNLSLANPSSRRQAVSGPDQDVTLKPCSRPGERRSRTGTPIGCEGRRGPGVRRQSASVGRLVDIVSLRPRGTRSGHEGRRPRAIPRSLPCWAAGPDVRRVRACQMVMAAPQTGTKLETADTAKGRPAHHRAGPRPDCSLIMGQPRGRLQRPRPLSTLHSILADRWAVDSGKPKRTSGPSTRPGCAWVPT